MTAHTRTANLAPGFIPTTTAHTSTSRIIVVAASVLLQAIIVCGFVSSNLGLGAAPNPGGEYGWASPAPSVAPVAPAFEAATATSRASSPQPAPAPAP